MLCDVVYGYSFMVPAVFHDEVFRPFFDSCDTACVKSFPSRVSSRFERQHSQLKCADFTTISFRYIIPRLRLFLSSRTHGWIYRCFASCCEQRLCHSGCLTRLSMKKRRKSAISIRKHVSHVSCFARCWDNAPSLSELTTNWASTSFDIKLRLRVKEYEKATFPTFWPMRVSRLKLLLFAAKNLIPGKGTLSRSGKKQLARRCGKSESFGCNTRMTGSGEGEFPGSSTSCPVQQFANWPLKIKSQVPPHLPEWQLRCEVSFRQIDRIFRHTIDRHATFWLTVKGLWAVIAVIVNKTL